LVDWLGFQVSRMLWAAWTGSCKDNINELHNNNQPNCSDRLFTTLFNMTTCLTQHGCQLPQVAIIKEKDLAKVFKNPFSKRASQMKIIW